MITDRLAENSPHKSNECNSSWSLWNLILCTVHHSSCVSSSFCVPKTRVLSSRISCQMPRDRSIRNNVGSRSPSKCPSIDRSLVTAPGSTTVFAWDIISAESVTRVWKSSCKSWFVGVRSRLDEWNLDFLSKHAKSCVFSGFWSDQMTSNRSKITFV